MPCQHFLLAKRRVQRQHDRADRIAKRADTLEAVGGKPVTVHFVGVSWSTGDEFDSSWNRAELFSFPLGAGHVIQGWDQGVAGMKVGGRRRITIPPELGYGSRGAGGVIAPNETLVFVVDLFDVG